STRVVRLGIGDLLADELHDVVRRLKISMVLVENQRDNSIALERREDIGFDLAAAVDDADHRLLDVVDRHLALAESVHTLVFGVRTEEPGECQPATVEAL